MKKWCKYFVIMMSLVLCGSCFANDISYVCANHILVESEADAINLKNKIKSLDDFKYYAKKYSICPSGKEGGVLGCFRREQMVKPFEDAAFNGNIGQVIGPVETQFGYHLIWVTKKY